MKSDNFVLPPYYVLKLNNDSYVAISANSPSWFITNQSGIDLLKNFDDLLMNNENTIELLCDTFNIDKKVLLDDFNSLFTSIKNVGFFNNEKLEDLSSLKIEIKHMYLEVTDRCNLNCLHCYLGDEKNKHEHEMDRIIEWISIFEASGGKYITVSGGELFLYKNWESILEYLSKTSLDIAVFTNGTTLNEYIIDKLIKYNVRNIGVSIHGIRKNDEKIRGLGAFEKTHQSLQLLKKMGVIEKVCLSLTPLKLNKDDLDDYFLFAQNLGISRINISLFEPRGNGSKYYSLLGLSFKEKNRLIENIYSIALKYRNKIEIDFTDIRNILTKFTANSLEIEKHPFWQGIHVTANGNIYLSLLCYIDQYLIGNIYQEPFEYLLSSEKLKNIMLDVLNRKYTIKKCSKCIWKYFCGGGNPATTYFEYQTIHHTTPYCQAFKNIFPKLIEHIALFQA